MRSNVGIRIAVVAAAGLVGMGCGSSSSESLCRRSSGAELCLRSDGEAHRLEGRGFRSSSELVVDGVGGRPISLSIDARGKVARSSAAGVLAGPADQRLTITGTAARGAAATFEFVVPASG